ncbi:MAG: hypothetical protein E5V59_22815 [Mesorhizobium sp.]|nr:MAG: hypothetical protein E5V59_22815 [Mesorhizobium sp.]
MNCLECLPYCPTALLPYCPTALLPYSLPRPLPASRRSPAVRRAAPGLEPRRHPGQRYDVRGS